MLHCYLVAYKYKNSIGLYGLFVVDKTLFYQQLWFIALPLRQAGHLIAPSIGGEESPDTIVQHSG